MNAASLFCMLATAHAWKMPAKASLLEKPSGRPHCVVPPSYTRLPTQDVNSKWKGSQRVPTPIELQKKDYLAEPYLHTIYFINLERSADRKASMEKQLNNTAFGRHFERYPARTRADAKLMVKEKYTENKEKKYPGSGTAATYLSHWHMLEKISKFNDSRAVFIVLEDDAVLTDSWSDEVMCQIKLLPADWDLFKFGYWPLEGARWAHDHTCSGNVRQAKYNDYTCNQRNFALEWMGNLGYAVRPQGAAKAIEHLGQVPIMDVDGAMMPGSGITNSTKVPQNVYVSKYSLIKHGKFNSVRLKDKLGVATAPDVEAFADVDNNDRETSYQARVRIGEAFKRGELSDFEEPKEDSVEDSDKKEVKPLAGLGA